MNHTDVLKATQDFLGNLQEDHSQYQHVTSTLKRELDSLDDFEHLGHDSSPITETKSTAAAAATSSVPSNVNRTRDTQQLAGKIDTGDAGGLAEAQFAVSGRTVGKLADDDVLLHFDPLSTTTQRRLDTALYEETKSTPQRITMDSNLLQMGGDTFPDRKEADDKLDKFLSELSTISSPNPPVATVKDQTPEHAAKDIFEDFKADALKQFTGDVIAKPSEKLVDDLLERFSDSDDDFKPSKVSDSFRSVVPPHGLPNIDQIKSDSDQTFKDFDEYVDYSQHKKEEAAEKPAKDDSFEKFESELMKSEPILIHPEPAMKASPIVEKVVEKSKQKEVPKPAIVETKPTKAVIEAEAMFCKMGLDAWFNPDRLDPQVESLIYWRDPKKSGPVFGGVLVVLLALTYFSLISVVAYLSLLGLTATISFRIYKNIVQAVQKTGDGHPFKEYLELNMALPQDKVDELCKVAVAHLNAGVTELRRLFLVEDLVDSIKFGVFLWCMTYLGAWFNGMTLIILAWVALFSLPKVYETNKTQIDANLDIVRSKLAEITSKVKAAVPIGKKSDEKKE